MGKSDMGKDMGKSDMAPNVVFRAIAVPSGSVHPFAEALNETCGEPSQLSLNRRAVLV
ncbi:MULTISPECIES: hypothetical protein [unclassified Bradyrhizobium]|uniref:hypothetical protein n=1 Tax=unclassified Bradyrhizobium TaxID=2631580 RepID=UPI002FEEE34F